MRGVINKTKQKHRIPFTRRHKQTGVKRSGSFIIDQYLNNFLKIVIELHVDTGTNMHCQSI